MKEINYKKILKQLTEEYPHELDKIEKVINDANKNGKCVCIEFSEIIKSNVWNSEEKARLLTFLGYNKHEHYISYIDEYKNLNNMIDYLYTIKYDIISGFEALMKIYKDIESHYVGLYISKDNSYRNIFNAVINNCNDESKVKYIKTILNNLTDEDIKRLIKPYYEGHHISAVYNKSIFINIIASKDLNLIKNYIDYVDNINMYLSEAVATGNIEIVKLFLEKGANINYLTDEVILGRLTPLKTAIVNNDYEMAKFLIDNGADVDLQINSDDFINRLNNYQIDIYNEWHHHIKPVNKEAIATLEYIRTSSPLEYAIKLRKKSDICYNLFHVYFNGESYNIKNQLLVDIHCISEQVKNRGKIVDLIFDKLEDKTNIDFNDLIGFTFISRDLEKFKKYSKYVIEDNYKIDFDFLFKLYFDFHLDEDKKIAIPFLDLIEKYDKNSDIYLRLFDYYINRKIKHLDVYSFYINEFNKELLNRISVEKRKKMCLVPYCKDIETLKYLISLGFDINQLDENGRDILFYLLRNRSKIADLNNKEIKLFNYLLENTNLSIRDDNNKTTSLYPKEKSNKEKLLNDIDMKNTLNFPYKKLDYNLLIQELDIDRENITFDEFLRNLDNFNKKIISLNQFYKSNIKEKYNIVYENLNTYLFSIIIKGIRKFGNEKLEDILNSIPNYDINSYVIDTNIDINYWSYVAQISDIIDVDEFGNPVYGDEHFEADNVYDDYNENILFSGGLMQYAILTDNLSMVQLLQERGANLKFLIDGEDHTWDYVNSYTMLNYIELFIGKKKYNNLDESEKKYYLDLIDSNIENNDKQTKKLVLRKDDTNHYELNSKNCTV